MPELPPILIAALTGFIWGLFLSIPVGPVNLTIINEGARRGFKHAVLIGIGASLMEVIYCSIAFTGFASFFTQGYIKSAMEVFSFAFMVFLGIKYVTAKSVPAAGRLEMSVEERLHPHSAFMTGFVRTMGNPGVLLGWIILGGNFISHDWVKPNLESKGACILGVALGTSLWFFGLSYAVSLGHKKFSEKTLLWMERGSGIGLLVFGLAQGCRIAYEMHKHSHL
ncbi:MAG: Lysine exporter protein [Pedosphaera sp.]|nr:Lysine exporter protein [Pedosphaera sp.]